MNKVLVLGFFGYATNKLDGQTVKTRDIYRLVNEQLSTSFIDYYDTEDLKSNKFSVVKMFCKVIRCNTLIYLPAQNNLRFFFPIIYLISILFRVQIHYFVVGGWLKEYLGHLPIHRVLLSNIAGIHAETQRMKKELEDSYNFNNVDTFPNFRYFDFAPLHTESIKLRLVFMARIMKNKGIDWIFELADFIDQKQFQDKFSITFYGQINEEDYDYFTQNVQKYSFVEYNGSLQPSEIHETLSQHDVMLLPTHFYTEGLPGSIVDAYISGIPVIVTDWKHSREFVDHGHSGYIVPFDNGQEQMIKLILALENNRELLMRLQKNALMKRMQFAPPLIDSYLNNSCK